MKIVYGTTNHIRKLLHLYQPIGWYKCASSLNWRSLSTELFTALHLSTCRTGCSTSLIWRQDVDAGCARRLPVFSTSARRGVSLSAIALVLLLAHDSGTVYMMTSSPPHHSQHFVSNWKHVYFGNHTRTLFYSYSGLEIIFTLYKKFLM